MKNLRPTGPHGSADELLGKLAGLVLMEDAAKELEVFMDHPPTGRSEHDENLLGLVAQLRKEHQHKERRRAMQQIAAMLCAGLILGAATMTMRSEAFRNRVFNFFWYQDTKYTSMNVEDLRGVGFVYAPSYYPEGYTFDGVTDLQTIKELRMVNNEDGALIFFEQSEVSNSRDVDAETVQEDVTLAGGYEGLLLTGQGTVLVWERDGYLFTVSGDAIGGEEAVKIAESLEKL